MTVNLSTNTHTGDAQGDTFTNIEIIRGSPQNDTLTGNNQANHLKGAAGNDTLIGLAGADTLDGEGGTDTASYAGAPAAVTVNLSNGVHTGHAQGDTFTNIEIIRGSPNNDTLVGNDQANHLQGAAGNDTLIGLAGADTLDGEGGTGDTASYAGSNAAVTVNLNTGTGSGGHAQGDTLSNIENLIGSSHNDTLIANDQANSLDGGAGTGDTASYAGATAAVTVNLSNGVHTGDAQGDTFNRIEIIRGSPQNDTLVGNANANHLKGAAGNDTLIGLAGADTLDGEGGTGDIASYADSNAAVTVNLATGTGSGGHAQGDTLSNIENLIGSNHNDTLIANDQANHLSGGSGTDTASYAGSNAAVTVNLSTNTHTGDAQGDTFTNIEIIRGSPQNDTLTGNNQANHLQGAAGNDTLIGLAGADTLDGNDTASSRLQRRRQSEHRHQRRAQGNDTLSIGGSSHNDTLTGNNRQRWRPDQLFGNTGNDTLPAPTPP